MSLFPSHLPSHFISLPTSCPSLPPFTATHPNFHYLFTLRSSQTLPYSTLNWYVVFNCVCFGLFAPTQVREKPA